MYTRTNQLLHLYSRLWRESAAVPPELPITFTPEQQQRRETGLDVFMEKLSQRPGTAPKTCPDRLAARQKFFTTLREMAGSLLGFDQQQLDVIFSPDATQSAADFVAQARKFDPEIKPADIYQAARNVWAMNGLQYLLGLKVELTPSIFAYSLLYPYSDNYLDDPAIPVTVKSKFNDRFGRRINGEKVKPANTHEQRVFDLIAKIEGQWDRRRFPLVYESLIAIHIAQIKSLALLHHNGSVQSVDVTGISLEKGGASVLADGYLVAGTLAEEQEEFMFGYGAFLQLVDDLQDVREDKAMGLLTIFTKNNGTMPLDAVVNKTFYFSQKVMRSLDGFALNGKTEPVKKILRESALALLINAAGRSIDYFTPEYQTMLQNHSPYRFSYLAEKKQKLSNSKTSPSHWLQVFAERGN
ncbi:hypothetical protein JXQ31_17210 [candidate division KSB1 bacterium]|nr:hypothetical protein [candidate division KSB1 bacterium]